MSNIQSKKAKYLKNFSNKNKVNLLLFEYSGHGRSSGKFTDLSIKNWAEDSRSIIKKLNKPILFDDLTNKISLFCKRLKISVMWVGHEVSSGSVMKPRCSGPPCGSSSRCG